MKYRYARAIAFLLLLSPVPCVRTLGADWPTFRHDPARSGITAEAFPPGMSQAWVFATPFAPEPAFGHGLTYGTNGFGGRVERRRIDFDRADSVVAAGGKVFFGSVGDGKVYCLEAATGQTRWTFPTGGPVRLAPTVWQRRVYFGSDDGWVYCLNASDGSVVWKLRAAPADLRVVGNGRLISLWPVRTGVLVDGGIAYFAAGLFPTEGVFLYAVDAGTGKVIWKNDREGERPMGQVLPLGYLLANKQRLFLPRGRLAPAVFDRHAGNLLCRIHLHAGGGSFATLCGGNLYAGWEGTHVFPIEGTLPAVFSSWNEPRVQGLPSGGQIVVSGRTLYSCGFNPKHGIRFSNALSAYLLPSPVTDERQTRRTGSRPRPELQWQYELPGVESVILAGDTLVVGGRDAVAAVKAADGKEVWKAPVDGSALSLTLASGWLYVSTDKGKIYGFAGGGRRSEVRGPAKAEAVEPSPEYKRLAATVLQLAPDAKKGFALVYGVEKGELALALARCSELKIYGVSPDAKKVAAARALLEKAGVYGGRVVVEQWPLDKVPYTKYFANLVVSETTLLTGAPLGSAAEVHRMTAPVRGTLVLAITHHAVPTKRKVSMEEWLAGGPLARAKMVERGGATWAVFRRPRLEGAGAWTHAHAGPGGTNSSEDRQVRAPLRVQWFGTPGPTDGPNRHKCASPALAYDGRLFFCSERDIAAYDVYNGTNLWHRPLVAAWRPDTFAFGGNSAVGPEGYFVAVHDTCHRLDPATGQTLGTYKVPAAADGTRRMWGCVLLVDGVLIGSRTIGFASLEDEKWTHMHVKGYWKAARRSDLLFAMDAKTGKVLWTHVPGWYYHWNTVAGGGSVFLTYTGATPDEHKRAVDEMKPFVARVTGEAREVLSKRLEAEMVGLLAALDVKTGKVKWKRAVQWSTCGGGMVHGSSRPPVWAPGMLTFKDGILLQMPTSGHKGGIISVGSRPHNCAAARNADTGELLWLSSISNGHRPLVIDDTIYAEPWAFELRTGRQKMVPHPVSGKTVPYEIQRPYKHCGISSASAYVIAGRSEGTGFHDLLRDEGTAHLTAKRANCWVSSIFAEGMALWPVAGSGCQCALPVQCSVALVHAGPPRRFAMYCREGPVTPVKLLALNLGAPGDLRDAARRLWLSFPRAADEMHKTTGIPLPLEIEFYEGGRCKRRGAFWKPIANTETPWVYTSAAHGLKRLTIPVREEGGGPAKYRVQLAFAAPAGDRPGSRVFDVALQGKVVRKGVDIVREAGSADRALVLSFEGVQTNDAVVIELVSGRLRPGPNAWPVLCGVILTAERL